ncbi:MAG: Gfo/Idh/MocA family oxidoreductase [Kiritimatiellae bacterium]|nr:Gfo/Idh/MocA family oxidoreductase [Kiritimatiellia bacterium]
MNVTRNGFLRGAVCTAFVASGGCRALRGLSGGASMYGFAAPRIPRIRLGVVGIGGRGNGVIRRVSNLPGVEIVAICDINPDKLAQAQKFLSEKGKPAAREFLGPDAWRRLCDDPGVDVVYNTTPWNLHVPIQLGAMKGGKHVFTEVPSAFTVDECWELVETSEKTRCHCMQLENCCYGEIEMLTFNLAKLGMLGELVHAEGAYIHDLRWMSATEYPGGEYWRFDENRDHGGNRYPTHGLVPLCLTFDINRGDRLDYLVSLDSAKANFQAFMNERLKPDNPRRISGVKMADMNSTLIKTVKGRSILVQHDVSTPRPYSRIQLVTGTKGAICDYPFRVVFEESVGSGAHKWFDDTRAEEIREKYRHPLWKTIGELAKRVGGHGGMDFIMDARWVYCLQQGLPLDMNVYDLAATSCLCELTEKSADNRSRTYDIPDFTRGNWRTNKPMGIVDIDLAKMGFAPDKDKV